MNVRSLLALSALILLPGCGGGGSDEPFFAGVWRGTLVVTENTSTFAAANLDDTETVNQDGDTIVLSAMNGTTYQGFITSPNSFTATRQDTDQCVHQDGRPAPGSFSQRIRTFEFSDTHDDSAQVTFTVAAGNCSGNVVYDSSWKVVRRGLMTR